MSGTGHNVTVTSPSYRWLGSSLQRHEPPVVAILIGKNIGDTKAPAYEHSDDFVAQLRRECIEMDIVVLFFEKMQGTWKNVPVENIGTLPYKVDGALTSNYLKAVRCCETNDEQREYLKTVGITIGDQSVGC